MSGLRMFHDQRIQKRREQEAKDQEHRRYVAEKNILVGHATSNLRVDKMRMARTDAAERREIWTDYNYTQALQDKTRRINLVSFEEHLAEGLSAQKAVKQREMMDKKRICDGSEELRVLKEKLNLAKVNKERAQQLLEIQVRNERDRFQDHKIAEYMENQRLEHLEVEAKLEREKSNRRGVVKKINMEQIAFKEALRDEARKEFEKDKAQVDAVVKQIRDEDAAEYTARESKKKETREQLLSFREEQKARQQAMKQADKDENARIEEFARQKREHEAKLEEDRLETERQKRAAYAEVVLKMESARAAKDEMEQLRNDLHEEEIQAEHRLREKMQVQKRLEDREELKKALDSARLAKEERVRIDKEEEDKLRDQLLAKFADDDRLEQMNAQRRRLKMQEHKREAERLIAERYEMYRKAREEELMEAEQWKADEHKRKVIIEDERRRLIAEHAAELKEFLPKDILEKPEDLTLLGPASPR